MRITANWLRDNSLSLVFLVLFVLAFTAQAVSGLAAFNEALRAHHRPTVGLAQYLVSGTFLNGVFSNWQGAFLQLACLVVFGSAFYQKGAAHSRNPLRPRMRRPWYRYRISWAFRHSLALAFWVLFGLSFALQALTGSRANNETRAMTNQPPVGLSAYVRSGAFWFKATQSWQAEFIAIVVLLLFSIYLREEESPESKPVESSDEATGESNT